MEKEDGRIKCCSCGHFISDRSMQDGTAQCEYTPDSHFGPELIEWICAGCIDAENDFSPLSDYGVASFNDTMS